MENDANWNEVVKVQLSLESNQRNPPMLIYNQDRSIFCEFPVEDRLAKELEDTCKGFYYAKVVNGILHIGEPAPWQDW